NVLIRFGSAAENISVTVDIEKDHKVITTYIVPLGDNKKTIAIPVTKENVGGFAIHYSLAAFNYFHSGTETIEVPYPKTDLEIETLTFRDKLQPGSNETWHFKVKGPQGDKVSAEVLASMYDMSLDQFKPHSWSFGPLKKPTYRYNGYRRGSSFGINGFRVHNNLDGRLSYPYQAYDQLNWFGFYFGNMVYREKRETAYMVMDESIQADAIYKEAKGNLTESSDLDINPPPSSQILLRGLRIVTKNPSSLIILNGEIVSSDKFDSLNPADILDIKQIKGEKAIALYGSRGAHGAIIITTKDRSNSLGQIKTRKNLQETAFFFPQLQTDAEGNVSFNFTTPEALTKWKLQLLAHTKSLESMTTTLETVTQKELMVIPNAPRFLRQGDQITISTKIANLTD